MSISVFESLEEMATAFPRQKLTDVTIRTYLKHLADYPESAVVEACRLAIRSCTFFPSVRELIDLIDGEAGGDDDLAEVAWSEVQREALRVGSQRNRIFQNGIWYEPEEPTFSTVLIQETVESVGWKMICRSEKPEDVRTQFIFTYRALRGRITKKIRRGNFTLVDGGAQLPEGKKAGELA